jgi:hypothetical protein
MGHPYVLRSHFPEGELRAFIVYDGDRGLQNFYRDTE